MKISLKELRANPFRDLARYPIHREKIEALKASIRSTGFWDNVVARPSPPAPLPHGERGGAGGHYELAYGHHRLEALKELAREKLIEADFAVDIPVRKLDDAAMIRIMANENVEEYKVTSDIIDETVRVTREYIAQQTKTALTEISASDISQFLSGSWNEDRVRVSLQRLGLFDRGTIRREQLKGLSHTAARSIQREVGRVERRMMDDGLEDLGDDEETSEQDRKRVRAQVQKAANHVAQTLSDHLRGGGSMSEMSERSLSAQAEMLPEGATNLSTIDAAARSVSAREFQRKVEMLLRYRQFMSEEARSELKGKLKELTGWCRQMGEELGS